MDNKQRHRMIQQLGDSSDDNKLELLSAALHSPITLCTALLALHKIGIASIAYHLQTISCTHRQKYMARLIIKPHT